MHLRLVEPMIGADDPEFEGDATTARTRRRPSSTRTPTTWRKQRRSDPRDDIVTKLLNAEIDGEQLSELEFDMFMLLLAVAGNETTRNATSYGMRALMRAPRAVRARCATTSTRTLDAAVEEILRWATPVLPLPPHRHAPTPSSAARQIKEGDKVVMWHISANRDEDGVRRPVPLRHRPRARTSTSRSAAAAPTSASAPTWPAWSCSLIFEEMLDAHPRHARSPASPSAALELHRRHQAHAGRVHAPVLNPSGLPRPARARARPTTA